MARHEGIITEMPIPPIITRGRPTGRGANLDLLNKLKEGSLSSCIFGVSRRKMNSIRTTASKNKIKITIRQLENEKFAIWRVKE